MGVYELYSKSNKITAIILSDLGKERLKSFVTFNTNDKGYGKDVEQLIELY